MQRTAKRRRLLAHLCICLLPTSIYALLARVSTAYIMPSGFYFPSRCGGDRAVTMRVECSFIHVLLKLVILSVRPESVCARSQTCFAPNLSLTIFRMQKTATFPSQHLCPEQHINSEIRLGTAGCNIRSFWQTCKAVYRLPARALLRSGAHMPCMRILRSVQQQHHSSPQITHEITSPIKCHRRACPTYAGYTNPPPPPFD